MTFTGAIGRVFNFPLQAIIRTCIALRIHPNLLTFTGVLISAAAHLAELADFLDIDGNLLITNDPFEGVTADQGILSFASTKEKCGLCVS